MKQSTWLRTVLCAGWCPRMVLRTLSGACENRRRRRHAVVMWPYIKLLWLLFFTSHPFGIEASAGLVECCHKHIGMSVCNTHTHTRLTALFPGLPRSAGTRKVKPIWILLEQETVSGSGINWAICKSASRSRQITMPAPHHSVFYRPDAFPAAQPTVSKHWRQNVCL